MSRFQQRGLCWLMGAGMTAAMMLFVFTRMEVLYATNDDAAIMRSLMGVATGEPARFQLFVHGLLVWPLGWLARLAPEVAWFSWAQIGMLALGCTVIAKSIMQSFVKYQNPLWAGAVLSAVFLLTLCMRRVADITFTTTSALLGAAAAAQMLSVEHERGGWRVVAGMAGALALVCLSYLMRLDALLPVLCFCGVIFGFQLWAHYLGRGQKRAVRPMLISLGLAAAAIVSLVGVRQWELRQPEVQDYLAWQDARTEVMDYIDINKVPQELFDRLGWDDSMVELAKAWCFLDSRLSTEAFVQLAESVRELDARSLSQRLGEGWDVLCATVSASPVDMLCLTPALAVFAAALVCACFHPGRRGLLLVLGALALCAAAMIGWLALSSRLPMRAMLMVLLPACAAVFALLPACVPEGLRFPLPACAAACALLAGVCLARFVPEMLLDEQQLLTTGSAMGDLEEYALSKPEALFLYDDTLVGSDLRLFPDYSEGVPSNTAFWGGWGLRSPESVAQFQRFGIDLNNFDPAALLRDDVYVASGRVDPPPQAILSWLRAEIGPNIDYELYSQYGYVCLFRFYQY